jgi:hypothetical protein
MSNDIGAEINAAHAGAERSLRGSVEHAFRAGELLIKTKHSEQRLAPIAAQLIGSHQCQALGIVATGQAPALTLCRELLAAGMEPNRALIIYRNGILSLRIRSIREAAELAVETSDTGMPKFRLARPGGRGAALPIRKNGREIS